MNSLTIDCGGESLLLHPEKVAYWSARKTLLVADVHIGKEHALGRAGIAVPDGVSKATLTHLFALVDTFKPERLLVLGDFVHGYHTASESWVTHLHKALRKRDSLTLEIVVGNHDKKQSQALLDDSVDWIDHSLHEAPFVFTHEPTTDPRGYVICGHVHPAYMIRSNSKQRLRAPVYWFQKQLAVLPAFGHFTGGHLIEPEPDDKLYITGPDCVILVH